METDGAISRVAINAQPSEEGTRKEESVTMKSPVISGHQTTCKKGESSDDDSDIDADLAATIHNNTMNSIAALKEAYSAEDDNEAPSDSFIQRYFKNHSNSLPSRLMAAPSRRLSQCREEDEDEEKKDDVKHSVPSSDLATIMGSDVSLSESSTSSKVSVIDTVSGPTHKFVITKTKQSPEVSKDEEKKKPSEAARIFASRKQYRQANTVHGIPDSNRPSVYNIFRSPLHYDSRYFDSSLIEMKSQTSSSSTIDAGSTEDIWVKRPADAKKELGSQPLPTTEDVEQAMPRPRSGTWGSKSEGKSKKEKKSKQQQHESKSDKRKKGESRSGSASRSNSGERRRGSVDSAEVASPKKSGGMLDAFRSRSNSDAGKKKGSAFMESMRSAMLHTGLMHARSKAPKDGSAHPVRDGSSHTQYYHTVTAASSGRSPITKVMDIFRNKSHAASNAPEDRRKKAHQLPGGGETTRNKWKNLRDAYAKYLRSNSEGQCIESIKRYRSWPWANKMTFLRPHLETSIKNEEERNVAQPEEDRLPDPPRRKRKTADSETSVYKGWPDKKEEMDDVDMLLQAYAKKIKTMSTRRQAFVKFEFARIMLNAELEEAGEANMMEAAEIDDTKPSTEWVQMVRRNSDEFD